MSQMSNLRAVSPQTAMDAAALIANQHTPVHRGPARLWNKTQMFIQLAVKRKTNSVVHLTKCFFPDDANSGNSNKIRYFLMSSTHLKITVINATRCSQICEKYPLTYLILRKIFCFSKLANESNCANLTTLTFDLSHYGRKFKLEFQNQRS